MRKLLVLVILAMAMLMGVESVSAFVLDNQMHADLDGGAYDISNVQNIEAADAILADGPWVDVRAHPSLSAAVAAIGASQKTLLISEDQTVSTTVSVPANVTLKFLRGGKLSVDAGQKVTIYGDVQAGLYHIFDGLVEFASVGAVKEVFAVWFGADPSARTTAG